MNDVHQQKTFKLTIEYDGTPFAGWQIQPNQITVQGEIQKALSTLLNHPMTVTASGRTDAGVHAMGQCAHFHASTRLGSGDIQRGLNSLIKSPIVIHEVRRMPSGFHARYDVRSKTYHYHILNRPAPCAVGRNYLWHIPQRLDTDIMSQCCRLMTGTHDFKSFEGAGSPRSHTVRTLFDVGIIRGEGLEQDRLVFHFKGNGFLRYMVRNLVGTLVRAGRRKLTPERVTQILHARDRRIAPATAPPQGLFLMQVRYHASSAPPHCSD